MDCNRPQTRKDEKGKGKQLRWETSMDNILIETLIEEAKKGNKISNSWKECVWKSVGDALYKSAFINVEKKHIESRLRTMKNEYRAFKELEAKSGFGWDPIRKTVTAPDDVWDELLKQNSDKYKGLRNRGPKWDYDNLSVIIGNNHATGSYVLGGIETIDVDESNDGHNENSMPIADEDINLDGSDDGASMSTKISKKRSSTSITKRKHGKKLHNTEIMQQMIEGMNAKIDKMTKALDINELINTVYSELMKMEGFSKMYLEEAFEILGSDVLKARRFLARDKESKKMVLEGLREKIGDV